jgi:hypothetical protein
MRRIALLGLVLFLAVPPSALASVVLSPPGHDGANQYSEVIPTSGGNAAPPGSVRGSGNPNGSPRALAGFGQGRGTDARLAKMGKDGQAAATLAAATAPSPVSGVTGGSANSSGSSGVAGGSAQHSAPQATTSSPGGSAVSGIASALTGSDGGGLGLLLPLLLATVLVAVVGLTGLGLRRSARHRRPGV